MVYAQQLQPRFVGDPQFWPPHAILCGHPTRYCVATPRDTVWAHHTILCATSPPTSWLYGFLQSAFICRRLALNCYASQVPLLEKSISSEFHQRKLLWRLTMMITVLCGRGLFSFFDSKILSGRVTIIYFTGTFSCTYSTSFRGWPAHLSF